MDCLFCKIASKEIPAKLIYEDNDVLAFYDIAPQAPQHLLIIPRKHIATINDLETTDDILIARMTRIGVTLAKQLNLAEDGYRLVMNCNENGGQAVFHIHLHLLGGRQMTWPPG